MVPHGAGPQQQAGVARRMVGGKGPGGARPRQCSRGAVRFAALPVSEASKLLFLLLVGVTKCPSVRFTREVPPFLKRRCVWGGAWMEFTCKVRTASCDLRMRFWRNQNILRWRLERPSPLAQNAFGVLRQG